ncbi:MAG: hypothetical protein WC275_01950 [Bacilli bacterium]
MTVTEIVEAIKINYPELNPEINVVDNKNIEINFKDEKKHYGILFHKNESSLIFIENLCLYDYKFLWNVFDTLTELMEILARHIDISEKPKYEQISIFD